MLPRTERLPQAAFAVAFAQGRVWRHPLLHLRVLVRSDGALPVRAAFVVPRKLAKAAQRNRVRRITREAYRLSTWRTEPSLVGRDLIFVAQAPASQAPSTELGAAIEQLLQRAVSRGHRHQENGSGVRTRRGQVP